MLIISAAKLVGAYYNSLKHMLQSCYIYFILVRRVRCVRAQKPFCLQSETQSMCFAYSFSRPAIKTPPLGKTHGFGLQYAAYWPAKCWVLHGKMHAFRL